MQLIQFITNHAQTMIEIIDHSLTLSGFVISMMLLVEYCHSTSQDIFLKILRTEGLRSYFIAACLAALPGCFGCFMVVTCYIHGVISLGALVTASVVTMGDVAFVVLARDPQLYLKLLSILTLIGVLGGFALDRSRIFARQSAGCDQLVYHEKLDGQATKNLLKYNLTNPSATRLLLIVCYLVFCLGLISGKIGHLPSMPWVVAFLALIAAGVFFVLLKASDHFIESHFMGHVFKKHFPRLFTWAVAAFTLVALINHNPAFEHFVQEKEWVLIVLAIILGFVPDSGPHLLFFTLYWNGQISFAVLLTSCIVQDGHGLVPLLASSGRDFLYIKISNACLALAAALLLINLGAYF